MKYALSMQWARGSFTSGAARAKFSGGWNMGRKKFSSWKSLILWAVVLTAIPASTSAQTRTKDTEWPSYAADLAGTRYRPLGQIDASNFRKLEIAWRFKTDNIGNRPEFKLEGTPLMVNGVVYATAGSRRGVIALVAASGELLLV